MKIIDIALKDLTRSFRSAFAVGMMLGAPLLLTGLIYLAFGGAASGDTKMPTVNAGIVNLDTLPADAPIKEPLGNNIRSMFFDDSVKSWINATDYPDEAAARAALDKQQIGVAVVIPANFSASLLAGHKDVQVLIVSDPTLAIGPQVVENMVSSMLDGAVSGGIAIQTVDARQQANGVTPDPAQLPALIQRYETWYADFQRDLFHHPDKAALVMAAPAAQSQTENPLQKMIGLMMAGQMIFFAFFTGANAMMSIVREDEEGTLARLFTTPIDRTFILAGKFLAVFLTVLVQGLVLMTVSHFVFGVNWGDPAGAALALLGQVIASTGLGVLLIAFVKSTRQGGVVLGGGLTVLGMLGGLFTSNVQMPEAFTMLGNFTPQGWVLKGWHMAMNGQPVTDLLLPFAVLVSMGAIMFVVGATLFRKRFA
jgi:ABC-2 type transport system permease protein